jgi:hypothetical protein
MLDGRARQADASLTYRRRGQVLAAAFLVAVLVFPSRAESRYECPELKGSPDPSDPSFVVEPYFEATTGCPIPLRRGVGHIPKEQGDFGLRHIEARYAEGEENHETTPYAKSLWIKALALPGTGVGPFYICHFAQYATNTGKERTMKVFVDLKPYSSYTFKGIITAYWISGHKEC